MDALSELLAFVMETELPLAAFLMFAAYCVCIYVAAIGVVTALTTSKVRKDRYQVSRIDDEPDYPDPELEELERHEHLLFWCVRREEIEYARGEYGSTGRMVRFIQPQTQHLFAKGFDGDCGPWIEVFDASGRTEVTHFGEEAERLLKIGVRSFSTEVVDLVAEGNHLGYPLGTDGSRVIDPREY